MSYFGTQLGKRPLVAEQQPATPEVRPVESKMTRAGAGPGPRPGIAGPGHQETWHCCPVCQAVLSETAGRWHCSGTCGAVWIIVGANLVDLAGLPYGVCCCCPAPAALARTPRGLACPQTGRAYVLLPEGPRPTDEVAPHGLCLCCQPAMPLAVDPQGLYCPIQPHVRYRREGGHIAVVPSSASAGATLSAIDDALHKNTAHVTVNGLFDLQ